MENRRAIWVDDDAATECTRCHKVFGLYYFKHHCRKCGLIYCADCSESRLLIPEDQLVRRPNNWVKQKVPDLVDNEDSWRAPKRVCDACSHGLRGFQGELRMAVSRCNQELDVDKTRPTGLMGYLPSMPQINYLLQNEIANATLMLQKFQTAHGEEDVPRELLKLSKGVVFLTIVKAGFMFSGRYGTGLVIAKSRTDSSWSAPSAITISGMGWGFQAGAEVTDVMLLLTTDAAVDTFMSTGQVSLGAELGVSVGPVGRSIASDVSAGERGHAHAFSYAFSQGLFFGASLEATAIAARADVNRNFYGEDVSPIALLCGEYPRPKGAAPLYAALDSLMRQGPTPVASSSGGSSTSFYSSYLPAPQPAPPRVSSSMSGSQSDQSSASWVTAPSARPLGPPATGSSMGRSSVGGSQSQQQSQRRAQPSAGNGTLDAAEEFGLGGISV